MRCYIYPQKPLKRLTVVSVCVTSEWAEWETSKYDDDIIVQCHECSSCKNCDDDGSGWKRHNFRSTRSNIWGFSCGGWGWGRDKQHSSYLFSGCLLRWLWSIAKLFSWVEEFASVVWFEGEKKGAWSLAEWNIYLNMSIYSPSADDSLLAVKPPACINVMVLYLHQARGFWQKRFQFEMES